MCGTDNIPVSAWTWRRPRDRWNFLKNIRFLLFICLLFMYQLFGTSHASIYPFCEVSGSIIIWIPFLIQFGKSSVQSILDSPCTTHFGTPPVQSILGHPLCNLFWDIPCTIHFGTPPLIPLLGLPLYNSFWESTFIIHFGTPTIQFISGLPLYNIYIRTPLLQSIFKLHIPTPFLGGSFPVKSINWIPFLIHFGTPCLQSSLI